jgi:hypothetical protein
MIILSKACSIVSNSSIVARMEGKFNAAPSVELPDGNFHLLDFSHLQ